MKYRILTAYRRYTPQRRVRFLFWSWWTDMFEMPNSFTSLEKAEEEIKRYADRINAPRGVAKELDL